MASAVETLYGEKNTLPSRVRSRPYRSSANAVLPRTTAALSAFREPAPGAGRLAGAFPPSASARTAVRAEPGGRTPARPRGQTSPAPPPRTARTHRISVAVLNL